MNHKKLRLSTVLLLALGVACAFTHWKGEFTCPWTDTVITILAPTANYKDAYDACKAIPNAELFQMSRDPMPSKMDRCVVALHEIYLGPPQSLWLGLPEADVAAGKCLSVSLERYYRLPGLTFRIGCQSNKPLETVCMRKKDAK